jgi:hypothetical protein
MARSFLVPINLNGLELQSAVIGNLSTTSIDGITTGTGRIQYDSTLNVLKYRDNVGWKTVATGGSTFTLGSTSVSIGGTTTTVEGLTLGSGSVWNGNAIPVANGGTGTATGSITGTTALTFTAGGTNQNVNLRPTGTGSVDLGSTNGTDGFKLTGLKDPTNDFDAANKKYVDGVAAGLNAHPAVNYATTGALGTSGNLVGGTITTTYSNGTNGVGATLTIATSSNWTNIQVDGVTVAVGERILIKNQGGTTSNLQNGIYTVTTVGAVGNTTSFVFTRAADSNTTPEVAPGDLAYVLAGTNNGGNGFVQTATIVAIGTTPIAWSQFSGSSTTVAGLGLAPNGTNPNEIDVQVSGGISINGSNQLIVTDIAGLTTGTTYGTVSTVPAIQVNSRGQITSLASATIGSLPASAITTGELSVARGGTGASTLTGYVKGNGTSAFTASTTIPGADINGAVSSATNATNSTNINVSDVTTNAVFYPVFAGSTGTGQKTLSMNALGAGNLTFNPASGVLYSASGFATSGTGSVSTPTLSAAVDMNIRPEAVSANPALALTIAGGVNSAGGTATGGALTLNGGAATGAGNAIGGSVFINGGTGGSVRGDIFIGSNTNSTRAILIGAATAGLQGTSQIIQIGSLATMPTGTPTDTRVRGTNNDTTATTGTPRAGHLVLSGGNATGGAGVAIGGDVLITGGDFNTASGRLGDVFIGASTTRNIEVGTGLATAGTIIIGTASGTGAISLGLATGSQTVNIAAGNINAGTKTVNIGTAGTGGTTAINIGSAVLFGSASTTTINGTTVHSGGKTTLAAHTTGYASLNIPDSNVVLGTFNAGDLWNLSGTLKFRDNAAVTKTIAFTDSAMTGTVNGTTIPSSATLLTTASTYVTTVNGSGGAISNIAVTNAGQTFTGAQTVIAAATQDAVRLQGRAGGTTNLVATLTPGTLTHNQTLTLPNANGAQTFTVARRLTGTVVVSGGTGTITHNMDNQFVLVQIFDNSTNALIDMDVTLTNANTVTVAASVNATYRFVIIG